MDIKEDAELQEDWPSSPYAVLQQISEEAFRVAGEAINSVYSNNSSSQPLPLVHRRSQSEVLSGRHKRSNSFQRLKSQMQKAWKWGNNSRDQGYMPSFNPEVLANQKRQWYQLHPKTMDSAKYKEPTSLFEHFVIAGLHPDANLETVEDAFARRKKWEMEISKSELIDFKTLQNRGPSFPALESQILFKYPPGKRLALRLKDLAAFCFPGGVKTKLLERTPSLSELNELVYGQEHMGRDDSAFIFSLKVADNDTLYGVCLHVTEIVQRPPGILGASSPLSQQSGRRCRFLVSAPRCYCLLTRVPFFELHYEMLNSIIAQERLNRITQFVSEMSFNAYVPSLTKQHNQMNGNGCSPASYHNDDWTAYAIPVDCASALTAAAAGMIPDDDILTVSPKMWEPNSPESVATSDMSDLSQSREVENGRKHFRHLDDCESESSESHADAFDRINGSYENGHASPQTGTNSYPRSPVLERIGSFDAVFSPVRSATSEDDDDGFFSCEKDLGDDIIMEWARENKNELLQIVCAYHAMPFPQRGAEILFQPLEHLQAIEYMRPPVSSLDFNKNFLDTFEVAEINAMLAAAEEAHALSIWTTATICRVLTLESILALLTGILLEKQVVLVCPNLGVLSATVLSLISIIRPFQWQSLFLPILPGKMLDFLEAPVPFIVGIQNKPTELKMKTSNLVYVEVLKNQVKMCHLPTLPQYKELISELGPIHAKLWFQSSVAKRHPVHKCNEVQAQASTQFLSIIRRYLESLCSDFSSHTITSVQSNNDRVSLLLKDSFIDSFPSKDRPFVKLFVDTQLFAVLSDARLSSFESRRF